MLYRPLDWGYNPVITVDTGLHYSSNTGSVADSAQSQQ